MDFELFLMNIDSILVLFTLLCILTIVIETLILIFFKDRRTWIKPVLVVNLITNPIMNCLLPALTVFISIVCDIFYWHASYLSIIIMELIVIVVETLLFKHFTKQNTLKCFFRSLLMNLFSFILGFLLTEPILDVMRMIL